MSPARLRVLLLLRGHPPLLPFNLELMQYLLFPVLAHQSSNGDVGVGLRRLAVLLSLHLLVALRIDLRWYGHVLRRHLI